MIVSSLKNGDITCIGYLTKQEIENFKNRHPNLGFGEIETILIGISLLSTKKRNYCVIDDGRARKIAKKYGISLTGTYGLIKRLFQKGILNDFEFKLLLENMKKSKFRINLEELD